MFSGTLTKMLASSIKIINNLNAGSSSLSAKHFANSSLHLGLSINPWDITMIALLQLLIALQMLMVISLPGMKSLSWMNIFKGGSWLSSSSGRTESKTKI